MIATSIGQRSIADDAPVFVIAEAGVNHNGSIDLAHRLVDLAAEGGADAVKFQTFVPESLVSEDAETARYQRERTGGTRQFDMLRELMLESSQYASLASHAKEAGLLFLSTPFDIASADVLEQIGVPAFKVPSGEIDNLPFLENLAGRGRPLLISTGMAHLDEVRAAMSVVQNAPAVCLFHCVTAYPTPLRYANLRAIRTMADEFQVPVGWSDHTEAEIAGGLAVAAGAMLVEKHLTVDRTLQGPDHAASLDGPAFQRYVEGVRIAETMRGDGIKRPAPVEEENRLVVRRGLHAARDLQAGERLVETDVTRLRPAAGLAASVRADGLVLARSVAKGQPIRQEDLAS